jgi:hypothetical protein
VNPQLTSQLSAVFKISPRSGPHRKQSLYCFVTVAEMCVSGLLSSNGRSSIFGCRVVLICLPIRLLAIANLSQYRKKSCGLTELHSQVRSIPAVNLSGPALQSLSGDRLSGIMSVVFPSAFRKVEM